MCNAFPFSSPRSPHPHTFEEVNHPHPHLGLNNFSRSLLNLSVDLEGALLVSGQVVDGAVVVEDSQEPWAYSAPTTR